MQFRLTRLAEGYMRDGLLRTGLVTLQAKRRRGLDKKRQADGVSTKAKLHLSDQLHRYPAPERLLATRLGNLIRSYEDAANEELKKAYGKSGDESGGFAPPKVGNGEIQDLLPFASHAIPLRTLHEHDHYRGQLQCMVTLTVVVPLVAIGFVAVASGLVLKIVTAGVGVLLTLGCRAGATSAGEGYGTMLVAIARQYVAGQMMPVASSEGQGADDQAA